MEELDRGSVCRKTGVSPEVEMDVVTGVELKCSYGAGDGRTRSGVASMPKERSGRPRLDRSCDWKSMDMTLIHQIYVGTQTWSGVKPHDLDEDRISLCRRPVLYTNSCGISEVAAVRQLY